MLPCVVFIVYRFMHIQSHNVAELLFLVGAAKTFSPPNTLRNTQTILGKTSRLRLCLLCVFILLVLPGALAQASLWLTVIGFLCQVWADQ